MTEKSKRGRILQLAKGLQVQGSAKAESDQTALSFDTDWGVISVVLDSAQLSLLIAMILNHANSIAPKKSGEATISLNFDPLEAQGIGVAPGPTPETAYVSIMMGRVNMSFILNKTAVQSTFAILAREIL